MIKMRLHGEVIELEEILGVLRKTDDLKILQVSKYYPDRGVSRLSRIYIELRADPVMPKVAKVLEIAKTANKKAILAATSLKDYSKREIEKALLELAMEGKVAETKFEIYKWVG